MDGLSRISRYGSEQIMAIFIFIFNVFYTLTILMILEDFHRWLDKWTGFIRRHRPRSVSVGKRVVQARRSKRTNVESNQKSIRADAILVNCLGPQNKKKRSHSLTALKATKNLFLSENDKTYAQLIHNYNYIYFIHSTIHIFCIFIFTKEKCIFKKSNKLYKFIEVK